MADDSKRKYADFVWGDPAPTTKQFGYALQLGCELRDGLTKFEISDLITRAIASRKPATKAQLRTIAKLHGVVSWEMTEADAEDAIEELYGVTFACPKCGEEVCTANDQRCPLCGASLRDVKIPLHKGPAIPQRARRGVVGRLGGCLGRTAALGVAGVCLLVALAAAAGGEKAGGWLCATTFFVLAAVCGWIAMRRKKDNETTGK